MELKRARDLAPNDALTLFLSGQQSRIMGRWDDALKLMNTVLELDPLFPDGYEILNFVQVRRGRLVGGGSGHTPHSRDQPYVQLRALLPRQLCWWFAGKEKRRWRKF